MSVKPTLSIGLSPDETASLRSIAKRLGFVIGRGRERDWGSIRKMLIAIAKGDAVVVIMPPAPRDDQQMALKRLADLADAEENDYVKAILRSLVESVEHLSRESKKDEDAQT